MSKVTIAKGNFIPLAVMRGSADEQVSVAPRLRSIVRAATTGIFSVTSPPGPIKLMCGAVAVTVPVGPAYTTATTLSQIVADLRVEFAALPAPADYSAWASSGYLWIQGTAGEVLHVQSAPVAVGLMSPSVIGGYDTGYSGVFADSVTYDHFPGTTFVGHGDAYNPVAINRGLEALGRNTELLKKALDAPQLRKVRVRLASASGVVDPIDSSFGVLWTLPVGLHYYFGSTSHTSFDPGPAVGMRVVRVEGDLTDETSHNRDAVIDYVERGVAGLGTVPEITRVQKDGTSVYTVGIPAAPAVHSAAITYTNMGANVIAVVETADIETGDVLCFAPAGTAPFYKAFVFTEGVIATGMKMVVLYPLSGVDFSVHMGDTGSVPAGGVYVTMGGNSGWHCARASVASPVGININHTPLDTNFWVELWAYVPPSYLQDMLDPSVTGVTIEEGAATDVGFDPAGPALTEAPAWVQKAIHSIKGSYAATKGPFTKAPWFVATGGYEGDPLLSLEDADRRIGAFGSYFGSHKPDLVRGTAGTFGNADVGAATSFITGNPYKKAYDGVSLLTLGAAGTAIAAISSGRVMTCSPVTPDALKPEHVGYVFEHDEPAGTPTLWEILEVVDPSTAIIGMYRDPTVFPVANPLTSTIITLLPRSPNWLKALDHRIYSKTDESTFTFGLTGPPTSDADVSRPFLYASAIDASGSYLDQPITLTGGIAGGDGDVAFGAGVANILTEGLQFTSQPVLGTDYYHYACYGGTVVLPWTGMPGTLTELNTATEAKAIRLSSDKASFPLWPSPGTATTGDVVQTRLGSRIPVTQPYTAYHSLPTLYLNPGEVSDENIGLYIGGDASLGSYVQKGWWPTYSALSAGAFYFPAKPALLANRIGSLWRATYPTEYGIRAEVSSPLDFETDAIAADTVGIAVAGIARHGYDNAAVVAAAWERRYTGGYFATQDTANALTTSLYPVSDVPIPALVAITTNEDGDSSHDPTDYWFDYSFGTWGGAAIHGLPQAFIRGANSVIPTAPVSQVPGESYSPAGYFHGDVHINGTLKGIIGGSSPNWGGSAIMKGTAELVGIDGNPDSYLGGLFEDTEIVGANVVTYTKPGAVATTINITLAPSASASFDFEKITGIMPAIGDMLVLPSGPFAERPLMVIAVAGLLIEVTPHPGAYLPASVEISAVLYQKVDFSFADPVNQPSNMGRVSSAGLRAGIALNVPADKILPRITSDSSTSSYFSRIVMGNDGKWRVSSVHPFMAVLGAVTNLNPQATPLERVATDTLAVLSGGALNGVFAKLGENHVSAIGIGKAFEDYQATNVIRLSPGLPETNEVKRIDVVQAKTGSFDITSCGGGRVDRNVSVIKQGGGGHTVEIIDRVYRPTIRTLRGSWYDVEGVITGMIMPVQPTLTAGEQTDWRLVGGEAVITTVLNTTLNTPPVGPSLGDRYIVAAGGVGAWVGLSTRIVEWSGIGWDTIVPKNGYSAWDLNTTAWFTFDTPGMWTSIGGVSVDWQSGEFDIGTLLGAIKDYVKDIKVLTEYKEAIGGTYEGRVPASDAVRVTMRSWDAAVSYGNVGSVVFPAPVSPLLYSGFLGGSYTGNLGLEVPITAPQSTQLTTRMHFPVMADPHVGVWRVRVMATVSSHVTTNGFIEVDVKEYCPIMAHESAATLLAADGTSEPAFVDINLAVAGADLIEINMKGFDATTAFGRGEGAGTPITGSEATVLPVDTNNDYVTAPVLGYTTLGVAADMGEHIIRTWVSRAYWERQVIYGGVTIEMPTCDVIDMHTWSYVRVDATTYTPPDQKWPLLHPSAKYEVTVTPGSLYSSAGDYDEPLWVVSPLRTPPLLEATIPLDSVTADILLRDRAHPVAVTGVDIAAKLTVTGLTAAAVLPQVYGVYYRIIDNAASLSGDPLCFMPRFGEEASVWVTGGQQVYGTEGLHPAIAEAVGMGAPDYGKYLKH